MLAMEDHGPILAPPRARAGPLSVAAALIGAAAIILPGWAVFAVGHNPPLQTLAEQSCRCARLQHDVTGKTQCWERFEKAAAKAGESGVAGGHEACAGLVSITRCFDRDNCVVTGYRAYSPPIREGQFCSAGEAAQAEALGNLYPDDDAAVAALEQLSARFAAGDVRAAKTMTLPGCGG